MNRFLCFFFFLFFFSASTGCRNVPFGRSAWLGTVSSSAIVLNVPFRAQVLPNLCGIASVEMVTAYYGLKLKEAQTVALLDEVQAKSGTSGMALKNALVQSDYFAAIFPGTVNSGEFSLLRFLQDKNPPIVMLGDGPRHYVVVTGYRPDKKQIILLDPAKGEITIAEENFFCSWKMANFFTLIMSPRLP